MDDEPMWAADRVVAPTTGSAITIPIITNKFAIKENHLTLVKGNQFDEFRALSQHRNESLTDAWLRMKEMLRNCHGHNLTKGNIIKIIYHGLSEITQEVLNAAVGVQELQSNAKKTKPDLDEDDIPMSREEETKFMQTFCKTRFYNDYPDRDSNRDNWRLNERNSYNRDNYRSNTDDKSYDLQKHFNDFMKSQKSTNAFVKETVAKNHQASIQNLETKFDRLADKQSSRPSGSLLSNTLPNPKRHNSKAYQPPQARNEHVNAVFTRSGKSYNPPVNLNDQQENSEIPISFDSDDEDDEPTPQPKAQNPKPAKETSLPKPYKPKIPIDVIDEILEEDFDALLDEGSKILHSIEGTLLEEEIFAEFNKFMAIPADENSDSESDTEEPPFKKITINTNYKIKTSLEEPPTDLEIKPFLDNLEYHKQAFAWKTSDIRGIFPSFCKHKIQLLDDKKPVVQKQRRLNLNMQEVVKKEIVKLLDFGIIYQITDSPWVSPIHCVPKKGGITIVTNKNDELVLTRTVTGWREINNSVSLMVFLEIFKFPIDPNDQEKTTFTCPFGTYAYRRMHFSLCNAPATFQRCMLVIFHDMIEESVEVFMDDFSVFGNSFETCLNNLDKMLQRCKDAYLVLNLEKCHFMVKEGIVLGYKVSSAGLEVDKAKIDVISKLPPLPILKEKLTCAPVIVSPKWNLPFELMCDSSDFAVGAVLGQKDAQALPTNDARVVVTFLKKLFCRFEMPKALTSDRGSNKPFGHILFYVDIIQHVGHRKDFQSYVNMKRKACAEVGIKSIDIDLPKQVPGAESIAKVHALNANSKVHGILVHLLVSKHINEERVGKLAMKDIDPLFLALSVY
uniref:Reverse transcriptase domain-containing protein n=1 Tax=Tanacetum cinerariifolium TaxID=118510 RepID=A0A6L2MSJ1_TANCI|nr:reverse transcriptase domain-containing protein [Tanacetum cinerariifolium]